MGAPGGCTIKAAKHVYVGPARMGVGLPGFPDGMPKQKLYFDFDHAAQGNRASWAGMPYKVFADGAKIDEGVFDGEKPLAVDHEITTREYTIELANGAKYTIPVPADYTKPEQGDPANEGIHKHIAGKPAGTEATPPEGAMRNTFRDLLNDKTPEDN